MTAERPAEVNGRTLEGKQEAGTLATIAPVVPGSARRLIAQWDASAQTIQAGPQSDVAGVISAIGRQLLWLRRNSSETDWTEVRAHARLHPIYSLLDADPLIQHSRRLSRPVLSEPDLLDLIWGTGVPRQAGRPDSLLGLRIFAAHLATDRNRAIRRLRQMFAEQIVRTLAGSGKARIAAVWCGYLRELDLAIWNPVVPLELFLAVNRDAKNTASVRRARIHANLKAKTERMWDLASYGLTVGGVIQKDFDLIYSLGVLDSVDDLVTEKFLARMVDHLAPGGRLCLCNSKADTPDGAFGEVFLNQRPFSRTRADLDYLLRTLRWNQRLRVAVDEDDEFHWVCVERLRSC